MGYPQPSLFIDGETREGRGLQLEVRNPATGEVIGRFHGASVEDIDEAALSAQTAFAGWREHPGHEREAILRRAAQLMKEEAGAIARVIVAENGKPLGEATAEMAAAADVADFYAGEARRVYGRTIPARTVTGRMSTTREPVGVVAAFAPWNFPAINVIRKIAPALAAGCAIVVKPAEETPGAALLIADCFARAGLSAGVLNLVYGDPAQISSHLIASDRIQKISFTGSTAVGRELARQAGGALKRMTMELGGHAPVIVCADADPLRAADMASAAKFRNAGQTCNSASRFYVHRSLHTAFLERFASNARALKVGDGAHPDTQMGPLSNARRIGALSKLVRDAVAQGARVVAGGAPIDGPGYFFQPTVLADVPPAALILRQEPFGPVAPVVPFDTLDEAVAMANSTPFALAGYVLGDHAPSIRLLARKLHAGVVGVNTFVASLPESPFGGWGESGWGHEGGPEGIEPYLQTRFLNEL
ncbi:MAG: NAD-dependent succinate-semialdehyde dehydrogenase [Pseudomonadota bacterium]